MLLMLLFFFSFYTPMLIMTVFILCWLAWFSSMKSTDKSLTSYECGFSYKNNIRTPFSTRFFLLTVIFLIFDIELVLIMPIPMMLASLTPKYYMCSTSIFFSLVLLGTIHEINEGALDWSK